MPENSFCKIRKAEVKHLHCAVFIYSGKVTCLEHQGGLHALLLAPGANLGVGGTWAHSSLATTKAPLTDCAAADL